MAKLILSLSLIFFLTAVGSAADDTEKVITLKEGELPPGMEYLQVSPGYREIVPKGTKLLRIGGALVPEGIRGYISRRFMELDERVIKMESELEGLRAEIENIKQLIHEIKKGLSRDAE